MIKFGTIQTCEYPLLMAPMEDISDPPFRHLCKHFGADMVFTEFIAADGLIRDSVKSQKKLDFSEHERPLGIQIFGSTPEALVLAAKLAELANPDLIDLNFGCPVRKVATKGGGAGMLQDIPLLVKITAEVVKSVKLPVTVKTRLGWDEDSKVIVDLAEKLQDVGISMLTIHGRTRAQLYKGQADWNLIGKVKENPRMKIPVVGNGDIDSPQKAKEFFERYGVDGIMIGRAAIGRPWIFHEIRHFLNTGEILVHPSVPEITEWVKKHLTSSVEWKGERIGIFELRPHMSNYFKGLPNFKEFRMKLVTTNDYNTLVEVLDEIALAYSSH